MSYRLSNQMTKYKTEKYKNTKNANMKKNVKKRKKYKNKKTLGRQLLVQKIKIELKYLFIFYFLIKKNGGGSKLFPKNCLVGPMMSRCWLKHLNRMFLVSTRGSNITSYSNTPLPFSRWRPRQLENREKQIVLMWPRHEYAKLKYKQIYKLIIPIH